MLTEKPTGEIRIAYDHDNEPYLFEATGKEAKHFCDILRAEDDGRLVILPEKLYGVYEWDVTGVRYYDGEVTAYCVKNAQVESIIYASEIGKTVFLTHEEAEAAFKEGRDDGTA